MKMRNLGTIKTLTIASLSVLALTVSIALAQKSGTNQKGEGQMSHERHGRGEGWGNRGGGEGGMHGMFFRGLNLTDDQKAKMKQAGESFRERTKSLHEELRTKRRELHQLGEGDRFDETLATQKLQESAALEAKLMGEQFKMRQEMLAILTPEQKTQLEQKRAEFKAKGIEGGHHQGERSNPEDE
jgi:protein CpxP